MLRPGVVVMRGSMVIRLRPCMRSSISLLSSTPTSLCIAAFSLAQMAEVEAEGWRIIAESCRTGEALQPASVRRSNGMVHPPPAAGGSNHLETSEEEGLDERCPGASHGPCLFARSTDLPARFRAASTKQQATSAINQATRNAPPLLLLLSK